MKETSKKSRLLVTLLCLIWSVLSFVIWLRACLWLRSFNAQSPVLLACSIACLSSILPVSNYALALTAILFQRAGWRRLSAEIKPHQVLNNASSFLLLSPIPVAIFCLIQSFLSLQSQIQSDQKNSDQLRHNVSTLAAMERFIAGPEAAGEVFYKWGHKSALKEDAENAEWFWTKSLSEWRKSRLANSYGIVFELDDLGDLHLLQGKSATAKEYFWQAIAICDSWSAKELDLHQSSEAGFYRQALFRAYSGLAGIFKSEGKLKAAAEFYEKALLSDWSAREPSDDTTAGTTAILADLYLELGEEQKAEALKERALNYQQKAVGIKGTLEQAFTGGYSPRAQSALFTYSQRLSSAGKSQRSASLEKTLGAIARARRHEINISKSEQDNLVDFIKTYAKLIIEMQYFPGEKEYEHLAGELKSGLSAKAMDDVRRLRAPVAAERKLQMLVRVDEISMSNRSQNGAMPVEATCMAGWQDNSGLHKERRRLRFLISPKSASSGGPSIVTVEDLTERPAR